MIPVRRVTLCLLLLVTVLGVQSTTLAATSAGSGEYSAPESWPLRGSNLIGCSRNSPDKAGLNVCQSNYHPVWAIDIEAGEGQPIYASGSGLAKVHTNITGCSGYGRSVVVDHNGVKSLYAHMSNFSAELQASPGGVWVDPNTVIGYVGHTGAVSNCSYNHLHYEESVSGTFWSGASDPGTFKACVDGSPVSYPQAWGQSSWNGLRGHTYIARNDGCAQARPDVDGDGMPDASDDCPTVSGWPELHGCPEEVSAPQPTDATNPARSGKAAYCRLVGGQNGVDSYLQCTFSTGTGFGRTITSGVVDWGYRTGRAWVDFNGDHRADFCRRVGGQNNVNSFIQCTLTTATGFGNTITSGVLDWGYDEGRAWVDFNGDRRADFCRVVGVDNSQRVACTVSTGTGFGATVTSGILDWGYRTGRAWVDFNGDRKSDFCRRVGGQNNVDSHVQCTLSTGTGFGITATSGVLDYGYDEGRAWVDANGDRKADYCRVVGIDTSQRVACAFSTGTTFSGGISSGTLDWGYRTGRAWVDFNGDHRADYCRRVGGANNVSSRVQCTLAGATGFGATVTSEVIDWGYETGRSWVDANGDHKSDFCRVVGGQNHTSSYVTCLLSSTSAFSGGFTSGVLDWGYQDGRYWSGSTDSMSPTATLTSPSGGNTTNTSVRVAWKGTDWGSGVGSWALRVRSGRLGSDLGAWTIPSGWGFLSAGSTSRTVSLTAGRRYCFAVRSTDRAANRSPWSTAGCITRR